MTVIPSGEGGESLTIAYSFPHVLGAPGIGWTAWNQITELIAGGHRVHVIAASTARPVPGAASVTTTLTVRGRRIPHRVFGRDRALALHDARTARWLTRRAVRESVDVVHAWPLAAERTFAAAHRAGLAAVREVPNTHTAHAYDVVAREYAALGMEMPESDSHTANGRRLRREEREWASATGLLVPSEAVADTFRARGFDDARLLRHRYGSNAAPHRREDAERPFTVVFLGRVQPRKGLHHALRAWQASSASRHGRLLVYGRMDGRYRDALGSLLDLPGVEVRGSTDDSMEVLAEADALVLPSVEDGSALVTYEAQVAGCIPLVSTAAGAVISEGRTGLSHEAGDVATLTAHLDLLAGDPALRARMRAAVLDAASELTWAAAARELVHVYRLAIARSGAAAARCEDGP